ncbi:MAG: hypothetical protein AAF865_13160 [Pseudomonadota bacterium]
MTERLYDGENAVSLDDLKHHLRIMHADDDGEIALFAVAAQRELELYGEIAITRQTIRVALEGIPQCGEIRLPVGPVERGTAVSVSVDGEPYAGWRLRPGLRGRLRFDDPEALSGSEVEIEYTAGFTTPPPDLVIAVRDQGAMYFDGRATSVLRADRSGGISDHARRIVGRYRGVAI